MTIQTEGPSAMASQGVGSVQEMHGLWLLQGFSRKLTMFQDEVRDRLIIKVVWVMEVQDRWNRRLECAGARWVDRILIDEVDDAEMLMDPI